MDYVKGIEPVTVLKTKSAELIRKARESKKPVVITTNGRPSAVLVDVESYQRQRNALLLLKLLAQGDQEVRRKKIKSHAQAKKHFQATLKRLKIGRYPDSKGAAVPRLNFGKS
ncbi:MAG: type II toxin-antitoxin system Phd/YefM family antitoxin [Planctomycetes bacterium]|nr:type II toxin-antitoxin system Phd/YefM family antitoxin [Planctomycetota bacterium]